MEHHPVSEILIEWAQEVWELGIHIATYEFYKAIVYFT
jgi:hypothetical protein